MKRLLAAGIALLVWIGLVWFTAWDMSPAEWDADTRFIVAIMGIGMAAFAATIPGLDGD